MRSTFRRRTAGGLWLPGGAGGHAPPKPLFISSSAVWGAHGSTPLVVPTPAGAAVGDWFVAMIKQDMDPAEGLGGYPVPPASWNSLNHVDCGWTFASPWWWYGVIPDPVPANFTISAHRSNAFEWQVCMACFRGIKRVGGVAVPGVPGYTYFSGGEHAKPFPFAGAPITVPAGAMLVTVGFDGNHDPTGFTTATTWNAPMIEICRSPGANGYSGPQYGGEIQIAYTTTPGAVTPTMDSVAGQNGWPMADHFILTAT